MYSDTVFCIGKPRSLAVPWPCKLVRDTNLTWHASGVHYTNLKRTFNPVSLRRDVCRILDVLYCLSSYRLHPCRVLGMF